MRYAGRSTVEVPPELSGGFGGISGIDRDARGRWYMISDDRSEHAPARFYVARLLPRNGMPVLRVLSVHSLRDARGQTFARDRSQGEVADGEAIRADGRMLIWASEGGGGFGPSVRRMTRDGRYLSQIALPGHFAFDSAGLRGPRPNASIEGLSFAADGALWLSLEAPLIEDGPAAGLGRPALTRLTRIGADGAVNQFAYRLDPIRFANGGRRADNGISEILALDAHRLLVLERSGIEQPDGSFAYHTRLYVADMRSGEDVVSQRPLPANVRPVTKTLLLDFDTVPGPPLTNIEGMAWAPHGGDAQGRLLLITDSNFDADQPTTLVTLDVAR